MCCRGCAIFGSTPKTRSRCATGLLLPSARRRTLPGAGRRRSFIDEPRALSTVDVVVLPGTRSTLADLAWLRARGLDSAILGHARRGGVVLGICGGFQMLGRSIDDPSGVEGSAGGGADGLALLDVTTTFVGEKVLRLPTGSALEVAASGYEIHHGRVWLGDAEPFLGGARSGAVFGTMWHGALEGDPLRRAWLTEAARLTDRSTFTPGDVSFEAVRQARIDTLADAVEEHLDMDAIVQLVEGGAPAGLPFLRGGLA